MPNSPKKLKRIAANSISDVAVSGNRITTGRTGTQINGMVYFGGGDRVEIDVVMDGKIAGSGQIIGR